MHVATSAAIIEPSIRFDVEVHLKTFGEPGATDRLNCVASARMTAMISGQDRTRKLAAAALAGAFALAACGAGDSGESSGESSGEAAGAAVEVADAVAIDPVADLETNLLPDLVVDNLNDDNKVNLRNYGVGDKPILLWMWAPH